MSRFPLSGRNETVTAWLGLGGNLGDPEAAMGAVLRALDADRHVTVTAVSPLYRTPPWGVTDQPDFLNCCAAIETSLEPQALLALCLGQERALKRVRDRRWGPRTVDVDILIYGDRSIREEGLTIPHPRMAERAFVLVPLAGIAPGLVLDGMTIADRAADMDRDGMVRLDRPAEWWRRTEPREG